MHLCSAQTAFLLTNTAMKPFPKNMAGTLLPILAGTIIFSWADAKAAVSFAVDPSTITNDFQGKITLAISNVAPGGTVTVQRYADLNGNGVIDAGEPLVLSFKVTDGQAPLINGVRNLNVPGDEDGLTNGQIRVELFVPSVDVALAAALKSIFKVTDPANGSATQPFSVSQKLYPQGVRGQVRAAATGMEVGHAIVALTSQTTSGALVSETDTNGNYSLRVTSTNLWSVRPNKTQPALEGYVALAKRTDVNVTNANVSNVNFPLPQATALIYGTIKDDHSKPLIGLAVIAQDLGSPRHEADSLSLVTDGNYSLGVIAGTWTVGDEFAFLGYPGQTSNVTVAAGQTLPVNFVVPVANFPSLSGPT